MKRWLLLTPIFFFSCSEKKHDAPVTWNDVAPVIYKNCSGCHRPGEAGGFSLLTYHDVVKRSGLVRFVTRSGYMPPWPADPAYSHFVGERRLTKEEKQRISDWVEQG